jgi:hypothetical protein
LGNDESVIKMCALDGLAATVLHAPATFTSKNSRSRERRAI